MPGKLGSGPSLLKPNGGLVREGCDMAQAAQKAMNTPPKPLWTAKSAHAVGLQAVTDAARRPASEGPSSGTHPFQCLPRRLQR
eukprot:992737-Pyramimonas_sp.AAC.1